MCCPHYSFLTSPINLFYSRQNLPCPIFIPHGLFAQNPVPTDVLHQGRWPNPQQMSRWKRYVKSTTLDAFLGITYSPWSSKKTHSDRSNFFTAIIKSHWQQFVIVDKIQSNENWMFQVPNSTFDMQLLFYFLAAMCYAKGIKTTNSNTLRSDCTFPGRLTPNVLEKLPLNCTSFFGDLIVSQKNLKTSKIEKVFFGVQAIYGCISIVNSPFSSLSFLHNLATIDCTSTNTSKTCFVYAKVKF